jgi:ABC-type sugar transport system ATPase subunit
VAIIYITHRLGELYSIADRVTVLRDGEHVNTVPIDEAGPSELVGMMFGEMVNKKRPTGYTRSTESVLSVRNLSRRGVFEDVSFDLYRGEVLGIAGMLGAGRTELLRSIFGADPIDGGTVKIAGKVLSAKSPEVTKQLGLALVPEDRKGQGLIQFHSIASNLTMAAMSRASRSGIRNRKVESEMVARQVSDLDIRLASPEDPVSALSGGNQQKVVVGNWINDQPQVVLFDEPTRGIDVNAKQQIFEIMWKLSSQGISSIFVSTELEELIEVCHRILVMKHHTIVEELVPENTDIGTLYTTCMEEHVS